MAYAAVRLSATASSYITQMREVNKITKQLTSEYQIAQSKAKLLGSASGELEAKITDLTNKISLQKDRIKLNSQHMETLASDSKKLKDKQSDLTSKIAEVTDAYQKSAKETGKNSDESQKLKTKLDSLKDELGKTNKAIEKTDTDFEKATAQGNLFKGSLEVMEIELEKTKKKLSNLKIENVTKKLDNFGNKAESAGKKLSVITGGVAGIGIAGIKASADFESGMSKVSALSGATGDDFEKLKTKAKEVGKTTKYSATEATDAMQYMALAGWDSQQMIDGIDGIISGAAASGEDLATVCDIVTDGLSAFGLQAKDSSKFADTLAQTAASSNTTISALGEAFKYCAPIAGSLKISVGDVSTVLGTMANAGIKGSQAGTSLKTVLTNLSTNAGASKNQLGALDILTQKLGVEFYNTDGTVRNLNTVISETREKFKNLSAEQQTSYAKTIAGKNAMSGFLAIMNASDEDWNTLSDNIDNCNGKASEMAETQLNNLSGQITILKSSVEGAAISIGEDLTPAVAWGAKKVQEFTDWFNSLNKSQRQTILKVAGVVAATGPLLIIVGKTSKAISSTIKTTKKVVDVTKTVITAVSNKSKALLLSKKAEEKETTATLVNNAASKTAAATKEIDTVAIEANATAKGINTTATEAGTLATGAEETAKTLGTVATEGNTIAEGLNTAAKTAEAAATDTATVANNALNTSLSLSPWAVVGIAIAGVITAVSLFASATDDADTETQELTDSLKKCNDEYNKQKEDYQDKIDAIDGEFNHTKDLVKELKKLAGKKGKVKDKDKERVKFILGQLKDATGKEYKLIDGEIKRYGELCESIDLVIEKKRAEAILSAQEGGYKTAVSNIDSVSKDNANLYVDIQKQKSNLKKLKKEQEDINKKAIAGTYTGSKSINISKEIKELEDKIKSNEKTYKDTKKTIKGYYDDIATYEKNYEKLLSGDAKKIASINTSTANSFKTAKNNTKKEVEEQVQIVTVKYAEMLNEVKSGNENISKQQLKAARKQVKQALNEYEDVGGALPEGIVKGIRSKKSNAVLAAEDFGNDILKSLKKALGVNSPSKYTQEYAYWTVMGVPVAINRNKNIAISAGADLGKNVLTGVENSLYSGSIGKSAVIANADNLRKNLLNSIMPSGSDLSLSSTYTATANTRYLLDEDSKKALAESAPEFEYNCNAFVSILKKVLEQQKITVVNHFYLNGEELTDCLTDDVITEIKRRQSNAMVINGGR